MYARYVPPVKGPKNAEHEASSLAPSPSSAPTPSGSTPKAPPVTRVGAVGFGYSRYVPGAKPTATPPTQGVQYFADEDAIPMHPSRKRAVEEATQTSTPDRKSKKFKSRSASIADGDEESVDKPKPRDKKKSAKKKKESNVEEQNEDAEMVDKAQLAQEDIEDGRSESKKERGKGRDEKKEKKRKEKKSRREVENRAPEEEDVQMADAEDLTVSAEAETGQPAEKKRKKEKRKSKGPGDDENQSTDKEERHKTIMDKVTKSLKIAEKVTAEDFSVEDEPEDVHPLEPLPQPQLVTTETAKPTYETLPSWLAAPIRVSSDTRTPFADLGILPKAARVLGEEGFPNAFAVQTAAIPLLLPSSKHQAGDVLISAATGSGKTLAYALPIVRDISQGVVTRFRALVVLPTRDLIEQAYKVFELCAKTYEGGDRKRVRIGVAMGGQTLKSEQDSLIEGYTRYDPVEYNSLREASRSDPDAWVSADPGAPKSRLGGWAGDVLDYTSKVDVLICTPGRLVEHIEQTPGFDLDYVRWLVVDEADKLLAQSYQGWLDTVMAKLQTSKFTAREFSNMDYSGVRKVVLSATLTSDLSLLNQLALRRPRLIQLEGGDREAVATTAEHSLPARLEEFAIRVKDTNLKPLYLLDLLKGGPMCGSRTSSGSDVMKKDASESDSDSSSDTSSDSSSDSDSDTDTSSSGSDSSSDTEMPSKAAPPTPLPRSLIFTKSNESALRLSRLLGLLDPSLAPHITTLTSTTPTHIRRKTLRAFSTETSPLRLIIASDLVGRGIDLPNLDHVVNYDLPPSAEAYVHRVGRTARAGKSGRAWTLVGDAESGWFWGIIGKGKGIKRAQKVGRVMIEEMEDDKVKEYEDALEKLGQEAHDTRKK